MKKQITSLLVGFALASPTFGKVIPNYAEADLVLGQVDFTSKLYPDQPDAASLGGPSSVTIDPVTRKCFITDSYNNRILRYASADSLANGAAAEAVFGQVVFTTTTKDTVTRNQFGVLSGSIFLDAKGRLWVPDYWGNRVLRFDAASFRDSSPNADRVYGQQDFTTGGGFFDIDPVTTAAIMNCPSSVCVDASDRLWVADSGNNRVLRFDSITDKPNGAAADGVLGQVDFTTRAFVDGSNGLNSLSSVTISANGTLYATCASSNRVMRFKNAASLGNNAPADAVLGQPGFATTGSGTTAAKLRNPQGAWITPDDSLWVADTINFRYLRFNNASTKASGAAADGVLGQPNFTTRLEGISRRDISGAKHPFVDTTGSLWVADISNNRVLRFSPDTTPPALAVTTAIKKIISKPMLTIRGTATDASGILKVEYRIGKGPLKLATGTTAWSFKMSLKKGKNIVMIIATDVNDTPSVGKVIKISRK
jgi:sugar lactone lactonase YvrE